MSGWVRVAPVAAFPIGERCVLDVDGVDVAVFHLAEGYFAIEDVCTHDGGELASGELAGCEIACPRHGARFDVRTGAVVAPPACQDVAVLPTRLRDGWVEVRDVRWD
ncbi:MAG: non-heme iron oxygenase ferredoxin subunit [Pseudomonadota bacterium]